MPITELWEPQEAFSPLSCSTYALKLLNVLVSLVASNLDAFLSQLLPTWLYFSCLIFSQHFFFSIYFCTAFTFGHRLIVVAASNCGLLSCMMQTVYFADIQTVFLTALQASLV